MGMMHEEVHCASWPSFSPIAPHHSLSAETNVSPLAVSLIRRRLLELTLSLTYLQYAANITYSVSTSTFLIMSSAVLSEQNRDVLIDGNEELRSVIAMGGGCTMIFDPEGRELIQKPASDEEVIVYADIDLSLCQVARVSLSLLPLRRLRDFRSPPSASFLTSVWVASLESAMDPSGHYGRSDGEPRPSFLPPLFLGLEP